MAARALIGWMIGLGLLGAAACSAPVAPGSVASPDAGATPARPDQTPEAEAVGSPVAAATASVDLTATIAATATVPVTVSAAIPATITVTMPAGVPIPGAETAGTPAPEPEETMEPQGEASAMALLAKEDLAQRLSIAAEEVEIVEVRAVTWPDASLGCPQPGMMYAQVVQEGLLIRLRAAGEIYFYHSGGDQPPFLCEQTAQILPNVTPKLDEFVPPPDDEVD